jgi:hypothetical protein
MRFSRYKITAQVRVKRIWSSKSTWAYTRSRKQARKQVAASINGDKPTDSRIKAPVYRFVLWGTTSSAAICKAPPTILTIKVRQTGQSSTLPVLETHSSVLTDREDEEENPSSISFETVTDRERESENGYWYCWLKC